MNLIIEIDAKFKVVSAASIIAKVYRDRLLAQWNNNYGSITYDKSFGSGYPSDEVCINWYPHYHHHMTYDLNCILYM